MAASGGRFSMRDLVAGSVVAVADIPDAMANASLAGVNPVAGLYALVVGSPVAALTTSSAYMTVAVTAAMALAVGDALAPIPEASRIPALAALTLMAGVVSIVLGALKADTFLRFVSNAVTRGFLTGVALSISLNQVPEFFGSESDLPNKVGRAVDIMLHPGRAHVTTLAVGAATLALILLVERTKAEKVAPPIALIVVTAFVTRASWDVRTVGDIASIPQSLPRLQAPSIAMVMQLLLPAVAVALIGLIQSAGIGKTTPNPDGTYPVLSRDFIAQGIGNVASGLVGGMPVGGSVSSTALNMQAGARSRWSRVFIGPIVAVVLLLLAPWVERVPMSSLAAVLILVGIRAVDVPRILSVWNASWTSGFIMASTFVATLVMPVQYAVMLGAVLSVLQYVYSSSLDVKVVALERDETGRFRETRSPRELSPGDVAVLDIYGSIFYAGADVIERDLPDPASARGAVVVLRLRGRVDVGSTFIAVLRRYDASIHDAGGRLMLAGVGPRLYDQLERTGMVARLGRDAVFRATPYVMESLDMAAREADEWLRHRGSGSERTHEKGRTDGGT